MRDTVDRDLDRVAAAHDVDGVPFAERLLAVGFLAVELLRLARGAGQWLGKGRAGHWQQVAEPPEFGLRLEAQRPGVAIDRTRRDVQEHAAVAVFGGVGGPAILDVQAVVAVRALGREITDGFAGHGEHAVGLDGADGGE